MAKFADIMICLKNFHSKLQVKEEVTSKQVNNNIVGSMSDVYVLSTCVMCDFGKFDSASDNGHSIIFQWVIDVRSLRLIESWRLQNMRLHVKYVHNSIKEARATEIIKSSFVVYKSPHFTSTT